MLSQTQNIDRFPWFSNFNNMICTIKEFYTVNNMSTVRQSDFWFCEYVLANTNDNVMNQIERCLTSTIVERVAQCRANHTAPGGLVITNGDSSRPGFIFDGPIIINIQSTTIDATYTIDIFETIRFINRSKANPAVKKDLVVEVVKNLTGNTSVMFHSLIKTFDNNVMSKADRDNICSNTASITIKNPFAAQFNALKRLFTNVIKYDRIQQYTADKIGKDATERLTNAIGNSDKLIEGTQLIQQITAALATGDPSNLFSGFGSFASTAIATLQAGSENDVNPDNQE